MELMPACRARSSQVSSHVTPPMPNQLKHLLLCSGPCKFKDCDSYNKAPFATVAAKEARAEEIAEAKRAAKTPAEKNAVAAQALKFASKHGHQREGQVPVSNLGMDRWVPELLHLLFLNVPKSLFKWLIVKNLHSATQRQAASDLLKRIGCPLDLRTKEEGRRKEDAWFSGAKWQKVVEGDDKNPGGLPTVICSLVVIMEMEMEPQSDAVQKKARAAAERAARASGRADPHDLTIDEELSIKYGKESAGPLLRALHGFDAYLQFYLSLNDPWGNGSRDAEIRAARALRTFKSGDASPALPLACM